MGATGVHIAYIDDDERDLAAYAKRLESTGDIKVSQFLPRDISSDLSKIKKGEPDLVLVDIRLEKTATYGGSGLGGELLDKYPGYPIVLLTALTRPRNSESGSFWDISTGFDDLLDKGEIAENARVEAERLASLALGYRVLRELRVRTWGSLLRAMGASRDEAADLVSAGPPLGEPTRNRSWRVVEAARWIRRVVLAYPGIAYDDLHAATALGIDVSSFRRADVQRTLRPTLYSGVFGPPEGRWWRGRVLESALRTMDRARESGPISHGFGRAYGKLKRVRLRGAKCAYSGESPADAVCYVLRQPVMMQYTLPYYPDDRPPVMDEARISFEAIQKTDRFKIDRISQDAQATARRLMRNTG